MNTTQPIDTTVAGKFMLSRKLPLYLIVFFAGTNLIFIQNVLVRELTTLLLGTELVVLLVSVVYLAGLSLGYKLSRFMRRSWFVPLGVLTLLLHLTLPIWFRLLVALFASGSAYWAAFFVLPLVTPFAVSAFYSIFLPFFVDSGEGQLGTLYAVEVLGSAFGILILVLFGSFGLQPLYIVYSFGLLGILLALGMSRRLTAGLALLCVAWLVLLPQINHWSNARWYEAVHEFSSGTQSLFTGYSPYQKVDVIETSEGVRFLFLDGLSHFSTAGQRLNIMMGQIPAMLIQPEESIVLGAGAMQTEQMIAALGGHVTTIEIDPMVVDAAVTYFQPYNQIDQLTNRTVVIDDARHFLATISQQYDLMVTDVPAAYSIQSANLYTVDFYRTIRERLAPGGIVAVNLTSSFTPDDVVSRRIVASLLAVFDEVMVITPRSVGWSQAYAAVELPFDRVDVEMALRENGEAQFAIFESAAVRALVGDAQPITPDSLDIAMQVSADWVGDRLRGR